jgi:ankyrin
MLDIYALAADHICLQRVNGKLCMLHCAIARNSDVAVEILQNGRCLGAIDQSGMNSLHVAARHGHEEVLARLLDSGLRVDDIDSNGNQPLFLAAMGGHTSCFEMLLRAGADVNHANNGGWQVCHVVAAYNRVDILNRLIDLSYERYVEFDSPNEKGMTPFELAELGIAKEAMRLLSDLFFIQERYRDRGMLLAA